MTADQTVDSALADIAFRVSVFIPDAEARAGDDGQVARGLPFLVSSVESFVELHGALDADEGVDADTVAVADQADRFVGTHDFIHNGAYSFL